MLQHGTCAGGGGAQGSCGLHQCRGFVEWERIRKVSKDHTLSFSPLSLFDENGRVVWWLMHFTLHCYHFHPRLTHIHTYSTGEVTKTATSVNNDSSLLGLSYQLASVDVSGRVVVWVVAEVTHPDPHGSETDFGEDGQEGWGRGEGQVEGRGRGRGTHSGTYTACVLLYVMLLS